MAYFNSKTVETIPRPIPPTPPYVPPTPPTPPSPEEGSTPIENIPSFSSETTIILYNVTDDNNVVNKNLGNGTSFNISLKQDTDVLRPTIILSASNLLNYNYAYISEFNRYYYIVDKLAMTGNMVAFNLKVDVLKTYANQIKSLNGVVARQETNTNAYLPDNERMCNANTNKKTIQFSKTPFRKDLHYLLTVNGGI